MELIPIFPRYLGIKHFKNIPNQVIDSWQNYIKTQPYNTYTLDPSNSDDHITINQRLLDSPIFNPLKLQILNYAKTYITKSGITHVEDVQIATSWGYTTTKNNKENNFHYHTNSLISGVFYLTGGAPLTFKSDIEKNLTFNTPINSQFQYDLNHFQINPKRGLLILFPSFLGHGVGQNKENIERISIAFNIIPKGEFGTISNKLYL